MQLSARLSRVPYVCTNCTHRLSHASRRQFSAKSATVLENGRGHANTGYNYLRPSIAASRQILSKRRHAYSTTVRKAPRVAIIGSGPAGFYTAYRLMGKVQDAIVDMYEQLPVPYGLARFGVAPDHPEVKNCQDKFEEVAESPRFNYVGNVKVGHDIQLSSMKPHYDAIVFAYGASEDKKLGIPGEDLPGVYSAREFVGWYNGLPQFQNLAPELQAGDHAVVIGQGNVALDIARILLTHVDKLRHTDIMDQALETLSKSKINRVTVVGRRGPLQAAFTVKEVRELMNIDDVAFSPIDKSFYPSEIKKLPRVQKRIAEVLLKGTKADIGSTQKSWALEFLKSPTSMNASDAGHLSSITFSNQSFAPDVDPLSKSASVKPTSESTTIPTSLAFRSVGYKSTALPGLSDLGVVFDSKLGIVPNDPYGRVVSPSKGPGDLAAAHVPGLYCAGWVKRGPTGVIASTMEDAFISADAIAQDWGSSVPFLNTSSGESKSTGLGWDGVKVEVLSKGVQRLEWRDWEYIDMCERGHKDEGKRREKMGSVEEMLKAVNIAHSIGL